MTLPASGAITSAQIKTEMGLGAADLVVPNAATLWMAGQAAAPIVWPTDFHGKTWGATFDFASDSARFGADASPGDSWTIPSGAPYAVGDLCVVTQLAESTTAAIPASVIPVGWTQIGASLTVTTADGTGARMNTMYRVITAGQLGSVVTGMNGTARNRVAGRLIHLSRPIASVTVVDSGASLAVAAPTAQVISWDSVRDGTHIYWGAAHGETAVADADFTWTTAADANLGSVSETRTWTKTYENTAPASSITMSLADNGTFNGLFGCLFRLT